MAKVYYFIPEDGDDEEHPNMYTVSKSEQDGSAKLGHIKTQFPIPGAYHFRFKRSFKNTFVWMDMTDDREIVPVFDGKITCKVSRLRSVGSTSESKSTSATKNSSTTQKQAPSVAAPSSDDLLGFHSTTSSVPATNGAVQQSPPPAPAAPLLQPVHAQQATAAQKLHSFHPAPMQAVKMNPGVHQNNSPMGNMGINMMQPSMGVHRTISTGSIPNAGANWGGASVPLSSSPVKSQTPVGSAFRSTSASAAKTSNTQTAAQLHQSMSDAANNFKL